MIPPRGKAAKEHLEQGWCVFTKNDEASTEHGGRRSAANRLQRQEHEGSEEDAANRREQTHGDIGNARLQIIFANILEIEVAVEARKPSGEGNEHLGQGRVYVHEELALDVFGSETTEAEKDRISTMALMQLGYRTALERGETHWTSSNTTLVGR